METTDLCKDCNWFKKTGRDGLDTPTGECRKYAPKALQEQGDDFSRPVAYWPRVKGKDFCGDFVQRASDDNGSKDQAD